MSQIFNLGEVIGSLVDRPGEKDPIRHWIDPLASDTLRQIHPTFRDELAQRTADLGAYRSAIGNTAGQAGDLAQSDISWLTSLRNAGYDPTAELGKNIELWRNLFSTDIQGPAAAARERARKISYANLGIPAAPPGSYETILEGNAANRLSSELAPYLTNAINTSYGTGQANRLSDLLLKKSTIGQPTEILNALAGRTLMPMQVTDQSLANKLANLDRIVNVNKNNLLSWVQPKGAGERWSGALKAVDTSLNSAVDTGMSLYGMMGGGGGGGGGIGSLLGGMGGGGGAGGGGNNAQLMQMLAAMLSRNNGGGGAPASYPWANSTPVF